MGQLNGKVAVITGGSRGLGLAIAQAYAREGAAVVVGSRSEEAVAGAVATLKAGGAAQVSGIACDAGSMPDVERLADHALGTFGALDIWVNNAALSAPFGPTASIPIPDYEAVVQTNVLGTYYGSMVALRHFLPRRSGKLINMLGRGANGKPEPLQNGYVPSKAWVRSFTRALAEEYRESGVGIHGLNPGLMLTDLVIRPRVVAGYEAQLQPLSMVLAALGNPPDVPAEKAVWLASAATDGKTGLEVRTLSMSRVWGFLARMAIAKLTGRPLQGVPLHAETIEPK